MQSYNKVNEKQNKSWNNSIFFLSLQTKNERILFSCEKVYGHWGVSYASILAEIPQVDGKPLLPEFVAVSDSPGKNS
jgi:hypothetical protein